VEETAQNNTGEVTAGPYAHISLLDQHSELKKIAEGKKACNRHHQLIVLRIA
jgi:hypothetical protein